MNNLNKFLKLTLAAVFVVIIGLVVINNYSIIFSRKVNGEIVGVERVTPPVAIVNSSQLDTAGGLFSFAVAVRDEHGVIHTASSEDRQWAVARAGFCVQAQFYPYPFWNFEKAGTYMNARLIQMRDCPQKSSTNAAGGTSAPSMPTATPGAQGVATPSPNATPAASNP